MDAQWADDVHHALHAYLTGETFGYYTDFGTAEVLAHALTRVFVHEGQFSTFRGIPWGAPVPDSVDRRRFVVFSENHDQVGNRALGDRPPHRHGTGVAAAAAAIILLGPFTPLLFQGQEWGAGTPFQFFTDHAPELGRAVSAGRLAEFGGHGWRDLYGPGLSVPDPQAEQTWAASVLDWSETAAPPGTALLAWHRDLIALRRTHLTEPHPVTVRHDGGWFEMRHGPVTVVLNHGASPTDVPGTEGNLVHAWGTASTTPDGLQLGAHSVAILEVMNPTN